MRSVPFTAAAERMDAAGLHAPASARPTGEARSGPGNRPAAAPDPLHVATLGNPWIRPAELPPRQPMQRQAAAEQDASRNDHMHGNGELQLILRLHTGDC